MSENQKPKILLADDSKVIRESIKRFISDEYDVVTAEDGLQAWEELCANPTSYDLLLSDVSMPNLDGYGLICRVRDATTLPFVNMPIVIITGLEEEIVRIRAFACGADYFIPKPVDRETLKANIRSTLADKKQQQTNLRQRAAGSTPAQILTRQELEASGAKMTDEAVAQNKEASVLLIGLDGIDKVKADFGEAVTQQISRYLGALLSQDRRDGDWVGQLDAQRYCMFMTHTGQQGVMVMAERLYSRFSAEPFPNSAIAGILAPRMGYATLGEPNLTNFKQILEAADQRQQSGAQMVALELDGSTIEEPSLEEALTMIENGEDGKLLPYAGDLALRVMPLLEMCNNQLGLDLDAEIFAIHQRLSQLN